MTTQFFVSTAQPSALFASMQAMAAYEVRGQLIDGLRVLNDTTAEGFSPEYRATLMCSAREGLAMLGAGSEQNLARVRSLLARAGAAGVEEEPPIGIDPRDGVFRLLFGNMPPLFNAVRSLRMLRDGGVPEVVEIEDLKWTTPSIDFGGPVETDAERHSYRLEYMIRQIENVARHGIDLMLRRDHPAFLRPDTAMPPYELFQKMISGEPAKADPTEYAHRPIDGRMVTTSGRMELLSPEELDLREKIILLMKYSKSGTGDDRYFAWSDRSGDMVLITAGDLREAIAAIGDADTARQWVAGFVSHFKRGMGQDVEGESNRCLEEIKSSATIAEIGDIIVKYLDSLPQHASTFGAMNILEKIDRKSGGHNGPARKKLEDFDPQWKKVGITPAGDVIRFSDFELETRLIFRDLYQMGYLRDYLAHLWRRGALDFSFMPDDDRSLSTERVDGIDPSLEISRHKIVKLAVEEGKVSEFLEATATYWPYLEYQLAIWARPPDWKTANEWFREFVRENHTPDSCIPETLCSFAHALAVTAVNQGSAPQLLEFLIKKGTGANVLPRMLEYVK